METLPFIVSLEPEPSTQNEKAFFDLDRDLVLADVATSALGDGLESVCQSLAAALGRIVSVGAFTLEEVEVGVEVNGEGGVRLIGSAKVGAKAAITLKFKRPPVGS